MATPLVLLVSGGSKGLGAAIAEDALARGAIVATFSRSVTPFVEAQRARDPEGKRFLWEAVDGADFAAAQEFAKTVAKRFGRIDGLVNNAGMMVEQLLALTTPDEIHRIVALNLELPAFLTQVCVKVMLTQRAGSIVNISSINSLRGHSGLALYSATKAALDGMTRSLAREVGSRGIRVNSVAPGFFASDLTAMMSARDKETIIRRTPLRRLGEASDVVAAVRFLLGPEAGFITGQTLVVDGGLTC